MAVLLQPLPLQSALLGPALRLDVAASMAAVTLHIVLLAREGDIFMVLLGGILHINPLLRPMHLRYVLALHGK